jgi:hypothetical protein
LTTNFNILKSYLKELCCLIKNDLKLVFQTQSINLMPSLIIVSCQPTSIETNENQSFLSKNKKKAVLDGPNWF